MAAVKAPKSILKKTSNTVAVPTKEERDRETALYHANLIQQQKDLEYQILLSTERLIDLPTVPGHTAEDPATEDVKEFKTLLLPFQPSDYDSLIEERNINDHCGYTLCPNPRVKNGGQGKYRILGMSGKGKNFRVVPKEELNKWCSEDCARRAMYVRVQLSERPAWERSHSVEIELLDEHKSEEEKKQAQLLEDMRNLEIGQAQKREQGQADLALERGDKGAAAANGLIDVSIKEKQVTKPAQAPSLDADELDGRLSEMHLSLEGYKPKFDENRRLGLHHEYFESPADGDSDEDTGMDWQL